MRKPSGVYGWILPLSAFVSAFVYSLRRMSDTDLWGHLKCGEYFFETGSILRKYYYNCSFPDLPYVNHEWLFQAVIYRIWRLGGETGLIAIQVCLILAAFLMLYRTIRLSGASPTISAFVLSLGIVASAHRFALRPQHFSFVFLLYFIFSLQAYKAGLKKYVWGLPAVMILWVNMHAESLWGVLVPTVFLGVEAFRTYRGVGMEKSDLRKLGLIYGLVIAASLINPFTYKTVFWPLYVMKEQFAGVEEILPPLKLRFAFFWAYFGLFCVTAALNGKRNDPSLLALSLVFSAVAWTANRGIPHFVFVSAPLVAKNIENIAVRFSRTGAGVRALSRAGLLVVPLFNAYLVFSAVTSPIYMSRFDGIRYPDRALDFMKARHIKGNVFNYHPWGNYIIWKSWPDLKPYIDGRFFQKKVYNEFYHILNMGGGWRDILARYDITLVLFPYSTSPGGTLNDRLFAGGGWRLIYWDDESLLYMKEEESTGRTGTGNALNPDRQLYEYDETDRSVLEKAAKAAQINLTYAGNSYKALITAANVDFNLGRFREAAEEYEKALDVFGDDDGKKAWIFYKASLSRRRMGDTAGALKLVIECISLAPDFPDAQSLRRDLDILNRAK